MKAVSQESPEKKGKDLFAKIGQTLRSSAETWSGNTRIDSCRQIKDGSFVFGK